VTASVPASLQQATNSGRGWCLGMPSWGRNSHQGLGRKREGKGTHFVEGKENEKTAMWELAGRA
jgi:hypothetical protein